MPSNGLLWPVKAPVYQVLPSLFFVSALMHSNIQGDVANLFTYVIYNTTRVDGGCYLTRTGLNVDPPIPKEKAHLKLDFR